MVYLAQIDTGDSQPLRVPIASLVGSRSDFTPLQWSIIFDAPRDSLASLRPPSRLRRFLRWIVGNSVTLTLANPHLESLRRATLLTWHYGFRLPANELSDFLAAGFSMEQFALIVGALQTMAGPKQKFARQSR